MAAYSTEDLNQLLVVELREILRASSLPLSGKKADLIARVQAHPKAMDRVHQLLRLSVKSPIKARASVKSPTKARVNVKSPTKARAGPSIKSPTKAAHTVTYARLLEQQEAQLRTFETTRLVKSKPKFLDRALLDHRTQFDELIRLTRHFYLTATNWPESTQSMFVSGFMLRSQAEAIKALLPEYQLAYLLVHRDGRKKNLDFGLPRLAEPFDVFSGFVGNLGADPDYVVEVFGFGGAEELDQILFEQTPREAFRIVDATEMHAIYEKMGQIMLTSPKAGDRTLAQNILRYDQTALVQYNAGALGATMPLALRPIKDQLVGFIIEDVTNPGGRELYTLLNRIMETVRIV